MQTRILDTITAVPAAAWDALIAPDSNPMLGYGYLAALELSGSLAASGFRSQHLTLWDGDALVAALPGYLKDGERGDPLVDWARRIAVKNELAYDPTLFLGIPFSSVDGYRISLAPGYDRGDALGRVMGVAKTLASGVHYYFSDRTDVAILEQLGFHARISPRWSWRNEHYTSFEAFLAKLNSKRRSAIRRDRRGVVEIGATCRILRGEELTPDVMATMATFHAHTIAKHGDAFDFYTPAFFTLLGERFADRTELIVAEREGQIVAASLQLASPTALYSRTCGSLDGAPFLHFEVTWYRAIEQAIARGLTYIDPGGPGEHKLNRGFLPYDVSESASWAADEDLHAAAGTLIAKERAFIPRHIAEQLERAPWVTSAPAR